MNQDQDFPRAFMCMVNHYLPRILLLTETGLSADRADAISEDLPFDDQTETTIPFPAMNSSNVESPDSANHG